jgi:glutamate-1-semialdehyde 2,1-aminomutase
MTNVGMVLPDEGYHAALREITRRTGTLLILDETHCDLVWPRRLQPRAFGLEPDAIVLGKPIAGGIPAAVYGFSGEVAERIGTFLKTRTPGHSGIGTTLSGSKIQLALMRAVLENYFTEGGVRSPRSRLRSGSRRALPMSSSNMAAPWHVVRAGARVEFMCTPQRPAERRRGCVSDPPADRCRRASPSSESRGHRHTRSTTCCSSAPRQLRRMWTGWSKVLDRCITELMG